MSAYAAQGKELIALGFKITYVIKAVREAGLQQAVFTHPLIPLYLQRGTIADQSHVSFIIRPGLLSVNIIQMKQASVVRTEMASVYTPMQARI